MFNSEYMSKDGLELGGMCVWVCAQMTGPLRKNVL